MNRYFDITPKKRSNSLESKSETPKKSSQGIYYFIIVILIIVFIFSIFNLKTSPSSTIGDPISDSSKKTSSTKQVTNTNTKQVDSPQFPAADDKTASDQGNVSGQEDPSKAKTSIKVLNGSGKTGLAQETKTLLEQQGFVVQETGNAKNTYNSTVIYYKSGEDLAAKLISETLKNYSSTTKEDNDIVGEFDIVVVVGKK